MYKFTLICVISIFVSLCGLQSESIVSKMLSKKQILSELKHDTEYKRIIELSTKILKKDYSKDKTQNLKTMEQLDLYNKVQKKIAENIADSVVEMTTATNSQKLSKSQVLYLYFKETKFDEMIRLCDEVLSSDNTVFIERQAAYLFKGLGYISRYQKTKSIRDLENSKINILNSLKINKKEYDLSLQLYTLNAIVMCYILEKKDNKADEVNKKILEIDSDNKMALSHFEMKEKTKKLEETNKKSRLIRQKKYKEEALLKHKKKEDRLKLLKEQQKKEVLLLKEKWLETHSKSIETILTNFSNKIKKNYNEKKINDELNQLFKNQKYVYCKFVNNKKRLKISKISFLFNYHNKNIKVSDNFFTANNEGKIIDDKLVNKILTENKIYSETYFDTKFSIHIFRIGCPIIIDNDLIGTFILGVSQEKLELEIEKIKYKYFRKIRQDIYKQ